MRRCAARIAVTILLFESAQAATGGEANDPQAAPPSAIEQVVVTSRKRTELAQKIPVTIQVVDRKQIERRGISSILDLGTVAPGVVIQRSPTANDVGVTIRGLGSAPGVESFDSSVSVFIDGVYAPRTGEFNAALFDIDRVEVVRGTQAALLGKNTSLGAIDVVTRKPGTSYEADIRTQYEFNLHSTLVTGGVDIPVTDKLRVRIAGQYTDDGGWVLNILNGDRGEAVQRGAGRITAVWTPTDDIDVTGVAQHQESRSQGGSTEVAQYTPAAAKLTALAGYPGILNDLGGLGSLTTAVSDSRVANDKSQRLLDDFASLAVNWHVGDYTLTSQSGFVGGDEQSAQDVDLLPGSYLLQTTDEKSHQFTEEARITSPADRRFTFIAGGLFLDSRLRDDSQAAADYPAGAPFAFPIKGAERTFFYQTDRAYSGFGQATLALTDTVKAVGGIRFTEEDKSANLARRALSPGLFSSVLYPSYAPFTLSRSEGALDGSFALQYQWRPSTMFYASWGQGTKSGGFAQSVSLLTKAAYLPEVARTVEVGVKHQSADGRLLLNAAAFHTYVSQYQLVTFTGLAFDVANTDLESNGFESEIQWAPGGGLRLFWNNTYADAYDARTSQDTPRAPRWTGIAGGAITRSVLGERQAELDVYFDYRTSETQQQNPYSVPRSASFDTINASLSLTDAFYGWSARLIGRNLADRRAAAFAFPLPVLGAGDSAIVPERPRTVAIELAKHF